MGLHTETGITLRSDMSAELVPGTLAGSDEHICKAARVSTIGSASLQSSETKGLINYLMKHRHGSPFEHGSMTFLIEAPIFVAREFMRHRIGWSYNETSGRYRELEPHFYLPDTARHLVQVGKTGEYRFVPGTDEQYLAVEHSFGVIYRAAYSHYKQLLDKGIAREVARMVLPVGTYTSFYATCNPRSLMHFLSLRTQDTQAAYPSFPQEEINRLADVMEKTFADCFPLTYEAFVVNGRVAP